MYARVPLLLSIALVCAADCVQIEGTEKYGSIEASAFDIVGDNLPVQVDLIDNRTLQKLRTAQGGRIDRVGYGEYRIHVYSPGFQPVDQDVRIYQPNLAVRVQLGFRAECQSFSNLTGSITPVESGRALWVKVIPLRGSGGTEAPVERQGTFVASGLEGGQYLLIVMRGGSPIHTAVIKIAGETDVKIDLGSAQ